MTRSSTDRRDFLQTVLAGSALLTAGSYVPAAFAQAATPSAYDAVAKSGKLRVGWAPWFPYAYKDPKTGQVSGITADLMKDLAASMKVELQFVEDGWGTMIAGLQADKYDMLMPMALTDGATISVALGSNTALYAKQMFPKARIAEMKGEPEAVTAVITGKSDAWASTYSAFSSSAPGREQLAVVPGAPFAYSPVGLVVRLGDTRMRDQLNAFLKTYHSSGSLLAAVTKQGMDVSEIVN
jgi:ABC-type amino acid transport substrate-binding protein